MDEAGSRPDVHHFDNESPLPADPVFGHEKSAIRAAREAALTMEYSPSLVDGLALLSEALDDPVADLQAVLSVLSDDLSAAIPAFLGLTVTLHVEDIPVVITTLDAGNTIEIHASLLLPLLPHPRKSADNGSVAFYSGASGAFIDLAHEARSVFDLAGPPVLDSHLPSPGGDPDGIRGLAALSALNQAVGVLVEDGHTQHDAYSELRRRAHHHGQTLPDAASQLLRDLQHRRP